MEGWRLRRRLRWVRRAVGFLVVSSAEVEMEREDGMMEEEGRRMRSLSWGEVRD